MKSVWDSVQIDLVRNSSKYPKIDDYYNDKIERKIAVLKFLKNKKIKKLNAYFLKISYKDSCENNFENFKVINQKFAIYELNINKNLMVKNITPLIEFDNKTLSINMITCFNEIIKIDNLLVKSIPKKTKIYLIYNYYPSGNENKSFISNIFL